MTRYPVPNLGAETRCTEYAATMEIELDPEERRILTEILKNDLSDLRMEIADTDRKDFRDMLSRRKAVLQKMLDALGTSSSTT
jgi:hypothetical protein